MHKLTLSPLALALCLLPSLQAQDTDFSFQVLPRDALSGADPSPTHSSEAGQAVGRSNLTPSACTGDVYSRDATWNAVSNAYAHDWKSWAYSIVFNEEQLELTAAGSVSAGGAINLRDPACLGRAYIIHQCEVEGMQGKTSMAAKLREAVQSASGMLDLGEVCIDLKIKKLGVKWCFNPSVTTHTTTGEIPMLADMQDESKFDTIDATAMNVASVDIAIGGEVFLHGYSNGTWPESASVTANVASVLKLFFNEKQVKF